MMPLLDISSLREITLGDPVMERQLMALFSRTAESVLARIGQSQGGGEEWMLALHELKGAALNIRANSLAGLCAHYEHMPADAAGRMEASRRLREEYERLRPFLEGRVPL